MRLAYLGTSDFAATVLRHLVGSPYKPVLVVTPPDRRQGRGRKVSPPPVAAAATELGVELLQTADVNEDASVERIVSSADVAMVCAFGQLIRPVLLDQIEMLNLHPSLLPRWRGAAPIERAIMAGDPTTGVGVMRLTEGLDSGPVAMSEETAIAPDEDFGSLSARLADMSGELAVKAFELRESGGLEFAEQPADGVTYAEKIESAERRLDPSETAETLARRVRALTPHVGVHVELEGGERLGVALAEAVPEGPAEGDIAGIDDAIVLGTAEGALRLLVVRPAGKREMPAVDYLRGRPLPRLAA